MHVSHYFLTELIAAIDFSNFHKVCYIFYSFCTILSSISVSLMFLSTVSRALQWYISPCLFSSWLWGWLLEVSWDRAVLRVLFYSVFNIPARFSSPERPEIYFVWYCSSGIAINDYLFTQESNCLWIYHIAYDRDIIRYIRTCMKYRYYDE